MKRSNDQKPFLDGFYEYYLNAYVELQRNEKQWESLMTKYLPKFGIFYAYFIEFNPYSSRVEYRPSKVQQIAKNHKELHKMLIDESYSEFESVVRSPKAYQHLPYRHSNEGPYSTSELSQIYLNCKLSNQIVRENDYYVVFYEEILFFQHALSLYEDRYREVLDFDVHLLRYLVKFSLSVEAKICAHKSLHTYIGIREADWWNSDNEVINRSRVDEIITTKSDRRTLLGLVKRIIGELMDTCRKHKTFDGMSEGDILRMISRFNIDASFLVIIEKNPAWYDLFVFPVYTSAEKIHQTNFIASLTGKEAVNLYSPVLLACYIDTLYIITHEFYDEWKESLDGFFLTRLACKLFAEHIIQSDYYKYLILKNKATPVFQSAVAQVFARNYAHNIGSHVALRATNKKVKERIFELYYGQ